MVVLGLLLLLFWGGWLFFGKVHLFETSLNAKITGNNLILAEFPLSSKNLLRRNQLAIIEFDNLPWPAFDRLEGNIQQVLAIPNKEVLQVHIIISQSKRDFSSTIVNKMSAKTTINVGYIRPLDLLIRSLGESLVQGE